MSFFDELGLRAAFELERNVGPYLALQSYKRLFPAPPPLRIQAALGALRCAFALDDGKELASLLSMWPTIATGTVFPPIIGLVLDLVRSRKAEDAMRVADAEHARHPASRVAYLVARLHAEAGAPRQEAWETALYLAERDGDRPTRARAIAALCRGASGNTLRQRERLLALADDVKDEVKEPIDVLAIAEVRLTSSSRFQRASALSALESLARSSAEHGGTSVRLAALRSAARHVDRTGPRLDPIEIDRVRSILRLILDDAQREAVLARLDLVEKTRAADAEGTRASAERCDGRLRASLERANALTTGGTAARGEDDEAFLLHALALDLVEALTAGTSDVAKRTLTRLDDLVGRGARAPTSLWAGIRLGLSASDTETRSLAARLASATLETRVPLPRRQSYVELGLLLQRASRQDVALVAFEYATLHREPEGLRLFASIRQREAYAAIAAGDRAKGLALLREAKRIFSESANQPTR